MYYRNEHVDSNTVSSELSSNGRRKKKFTDASSVKYSVGKNIGF